MPVIRGHITRHLFSNSADNYHVYEFHRAGNHHPYKHPVITISFHGHQPPQEGHDMAIHGHWNKIEGRGWRFTVERYEPMSAHAERHERNINKLYDMLYSP